MAAYNYLAQGNPGGSGNPGGVYNVSPGQLNSGTQSGGGGSDFQDMFRRMMTQWQEQGGSGANETGMRVLQDMFGGMRGRGQEGSYGGDERGNRDRESRYGEYSQARQGGANVGQDPSLGRYRAPQMDQYGNQAGGDMGGYAYNLPNAFGAERFGGVAPNWNRNAANMYGRMADRYQKPGGMGDPYRPPGGGPPSDEFQPSNPGLTKPGQGYVNPLKLPPQTLPVEPVTPMWSDRGDAMGSRNRFGSWSQRR